MEEYNKKNICLRLTRYISRNKFLLAVLIFYGLLMLSIIDWGIPNQNHPFTYNMDEWHQMQAVRTTFKYLSPNVPGSAHGTMFHFILTGIYLIPFYALGIIDPFGITSPVSSLVAQHRLFEVLRLNTLIFGLLSIFYIAKIAKDYLRTSQNLAIILFVISPLWLSLSNYFKYDIALTFWIILSLFFLLKFGAKTTLKNYLVSGFVCSLSVATKISALPIFLAYLVSYFWFKNKSKWKLSEVGLGILFFLITFIFLGIPDLILGKGNWGEFLYSNLISGSSGYNNILSGFNSWQQYLLLRIFPLDFGYGFFLIYVLGIMYWTVSVFGSFLKKEWFSFRKETFLLLCLFLFIFSLVSLKLGANGNRLLVLLPFFSLLSAAFLGRIKNVFKKRKFMIIGLLSIVFAVQLYQSAILIYVKWLPDARQASSEWMKKNIKKNAQIGIENIPIYQLLPDVIVKDFYSGNKTKDYGNDFRYQVIDASGRMIPSTVVIANKELDLYYFKSSQKKDLIGKLMRGRYKEIRKFGPPQALYSFFGNELDYFFSGLAPISTISIFSKVE